jgi:hypothetical protein
MDTPTDPVRASLDAKITATAVQLGTETPTVTIGREGHRRTAQLAFTDTNHLIAWVAWLHWPWANHRQDDRLVYTGYGEWAGYACTLVGDETLESVPAAG